jgi:hypothetical protein
VPKIYLETSVFNFRFVDDAPDKKRDTLRLFDEIKQGKYEPYTSDYVLDELKNAQNPSARKVLTTRSSASPRTVYALPFGEPQTDTNAMPVWVGVWVAGIARLRKETNMNDNILVDALYALSGKLQDISIEHLDLKVCGGFAVYRFTGEMTRDIDNTFTLSQNLKALIEQLSNEFEGGMLDDDWLNDDWNNFEAKSWQAKQIDSNIQWESAPEITLPNLTVTFAQLSSLMCMKYFAITERLKPKDIRDFSKMMENNNISVDMFLQMLKDHGVTNRNDLEDVISNLYLYNLINETEYVQLCKSGG